MHEEVFRRILYGLLKASYRRWEHASSRGSFHSVSRALGAKGIQLLGDWSWGDFTSKFWRVVAFPSGVLDFGRGKFLLPLPPIEKESHLVPFLYMQGMVREDAWCLRLYVLLFTTRHTEFQGFAIRFESPERCFDPTAQREPGAHDFFHAQLCREVGKGIVKLRAPAWLPETQPSFFLKAESEFDLFFNMVTSMYSSKEGWDLRREMLNGWRKKPQYDFLRSRLDEAFRTEPKSSGLGYGP